MAASPPSTWTQFFPPKPTFTDEDIPADLQGKVYIVTGANSGLGLELARVLYSKHSKVYVACRSEEKANKAIEHIKTATGDSKGTLVPLLLDLSNLNKTKTAAETFLENESRLDVLYNNAAVFPGETKPPKRTIHGHELALGVNCVGPFLFTKLLTPILQATAKTEQHGSVRVVWISSYGLNIAAPKEKGIDMSNLDYNVPKSGVDRYGISKAGDWLLAVEYARKYEADGIVSVAVNPGNLKTNLARNQSCLIHTVAAALCYPVIYGVYTELFAGFAPEVSKYDWKSEWVIPWGRVVPLRSDLPIAARPKEDGGNGNAQEFWEWNEEQVKDYS